MKELDILGKSKHTLTPPIYFQGGQDPPTARNHVHVCYNIPTPMYLPISIITRLQEPAITDNMIRRCAFSRHTTARVEDSA